MASTYELIASQTLGSDTASVTFSSIPQTYDDLVVVASARSARTVYVADNLNVQFNSDTGSNYSYRYIQGDGASATSASSSSQTQIIACYTSTAAATSSTFGNAAIYIPNYAGSAYKSISAESATETNGTIAYIVATAGLWSSTSAITSMKLISQVANFVTGSSFQLFGVSHA